MRQESREWQQQGDTPMTRKQQNLLNAACQDLSDSLRFWHGLRFSKDDFRHLISAVVLGERLVPGINTGHGPPGLIRMARSSTELTKSQATEAIRTAFEIGDNPKDQGLDVPQIRWGATVCLARFVADESDNQGA